ncbi:MAG: 3'-5' exonuclease [Gemmatimonadetes bacterium]|nr:3'-5' exonuclease [Gemmatimonadota bacterium]
MTGLAVHPEGRLVDRALQYLSSGPADSSVLTHQVLGIPMATPFVAERLVAALLGADPRVGRLGDGRWMLVAPATASPALSDSAFAVVDVETTGGMAGRGDRITEIAIVVVCGEQVELLYESLVNPGRPIPRAVTQVTNITDEMVRDRPAFAEIADEVLAVLAGRIFVAHNMSFDWRFVSSELRLVHGVGLEGPKLCTIKLARRFLPGLKSRSLDSLAYYFGMEIERRHRAGPDALATGHILQRLLRLAQESGASTLNDLWELSRRRARRRRRRRARPESMGEL